MNIDQTEGRISIAKSSSENTENPYESLEWSGAGTELGHALRMHQDLELAGCDVNFFEIQHALFTAGLITDREFVQGGPLVMELLEEPIFHCSEIYPEDEPWWSDDMKAQYEEMPRIPSRIIVYINERDSSVVRRVGEILTDFMSVAWEKLDAPSQSSPELDEFALKTLAVAEEISDLGWQFSKISAKLARGPFHITIDDEGISVHQGTSFSRRFDWECPEKEKWDLLARLCDQADLDLLVANDKSDIVDALKRIRDPKK